MSNDLEGLGEQISAGRHLNGRQLGAAAICRQDQRLSLYGHPGSSGLPRHPLRLVTRGQSPAEPEEPPPPSRAPPRSRAGEAGRAAARTHRGGANGAGSCTARPVSVGGKFLTSLSYLRGGGRGGVVHRCLAKLRGASVLPRVLPPACPVSGSGAHTVSAAALGTRAPIHPSPLTSTGIAKAPLALPLISASSITPDKLDLAPTRHTAKSRPGLCAERGGGRSSGAGSVPSRPAELPSTRLLSLRLCPGRSFQTSAPPRSVRLGRRGSPRRGS